MRDELVFFFLRLVHKPEHDGAFALGTECNGIDRRDIVAQRLVTLAEFDADGRPRPNNFAGAVLDRLAECGFDMCHDVAVFIFEGKEVLAVFGNEVGCHVLCGIIEVPPASVPGVGGHKSVLVVGILEVVEQQRAALFGKRARGGTFARDDLHISAAGVPSFLGRDKHEAQGACGEGIHGKLSVFHFCGMRHAADLHDAVPVATHGSGNANHPVEHV